MILEIRNRTDTRNTYRSTTAPTIVEPGQKTTITEEVEIIKLCLDHEIWNHLINDKINIGDGAIEFKGPGAIRYIKQMATLLMLKKIAAI